MIFGRKCHGERIIIISVLIRLNNSNNLYKYLNLYLVPEEPNPQNYPPSYAISKRADLGSNFFYYHVRMESDGVPICNRLP